MKTITAFKFVGKDLTNCGFKWEVGKWFTQTGKLKLCQNGFHASKKPIDVLNYTDNGERLFTVEARGKILKDDDKFCSSEMRLTKEIPRKVIQWFAIACARRALKNWDKKYPNDKRPLEAIESAEAYLNNPTKENLEKLNTAESAAGSARSAAWSAAGSAESAAGSAAESARSAAWSAAGSAESAAGSAAGSARSAAWSAAESARSAAESARSAAESAAGSAARSAERRWQNSMLKKLIKEATG